MMSKFVQYNNLPQNLKTSKAIMVEQPLERYKERQYQASFVPAHRQIRSHEQQIMNNSVSTNSVGLHHNFNNKAVLNTFKAPNTTIINGESSKQNNFAPRLNTGQETKVQIPKTIQQHLVPQQSKILSVTSETNSVKSNNVPEKEEEANSVVTRGIVYGTTELEKMFIFTGSVESVLKWAKIFQNHSCLFEVIAPVVAATDGNVDFQKVLLLKDKKGPILQVVYYANSTYMKINNFAYDQYLRCVGRMTRSNVLSAENIREASAKEVAELARLKCICESATSHFFS